uniref:Uncharacterized protein n=1 Tax=Panagrolaimus sp. PS1159 TaxID=55785 RepID=A0AC35GY37_9BILA
MTIFNAGTSVFLLLYFINLFYQVNCAGSNSNNECYNTSVLSGGQELKAVDKPMYRYEKRVADNLYYVVVGNEPFMIWINTDNFNLNTDIDAKAIPIGNLANRGNRRIYIEIFGRSDCQKNFKDSLKFKAECQNCTRYNDQYVPIKIWAVGGPVLFGMKQNHINLKFYLPKPLFEAYNVGWCASVGFMNPLIGMDYMALITNSTTTNDEKEYLLLRKEYTDVFIELNDINPEHFLKIELEDGKTSKNNVIIELEANDLKPEIVSEKLLSNGIKIQLKTKFCLYSYNFVGFVRYVFRTSVFDKFKVSFYDLENKNLKMKFCPLENCGMLKRNTQHNFRTFLIPPLIVISTTPSPTTNIISSSLMTTSIISSSTVSSSSTSASSTKEIIGTSSSSSTTTVFQNNNSNENDKNVKIEQTSLIPFKPTPNGIIFENTKASEESEGMSLSILIAIIIGSIFGLLLLICIIVICILRFYRKYQRKKYDLNLETQAEEAIRQKRTIWKNIIIALIGPSPKPSKNKKIVPTSLKSTPARKKKRDPRFPHLIPGTIEFIVAQQQCDAGSDVDLENGPKSGPRDESEVAQFLHP